MSFETLYLSSEILRAIDEQGYSKPTPVQIQAIPHILQGKDVIVTAQTGTGKTAAFTLPLLELIIKNNKQTGTSSNLKAPIRALIITPTRELAAQVCESVQTYSKYLSLKSMAVYGGVNIAMQITKLQRRVDILIATPGRLLDLVNQRAVDLSKVDTLVLDEADRMLDMGFIHDIRKILQLLPKSRQSLLFSATFPQEIKELTHKFLSSPVFIEVARRTATAEGISQVVYPVEQKRKRELLSFIIGSKNWQQVLVFMRTKHGANRLTKDLNSDGLVSVAIHGNKTQAARTRALADFKTGKVRVLVATDIAARGLDIDQLPYVVNFELPSVPEDYVHRVGRTGRANYNGMAVSLVSGDEQKLLKDIEKLLKFKVPQTVIAGYESSSVSKPGMLQAALTQVQNKNKKYYAQSNSSRQTQSNRKHKKYR